MRSWRVMLLVVLVLLAGGAQAQLQSLVLTKGSTSSSVDFTLQPMGESRLALQFDVPIVVTRITLVDPAGKPRDLALGSAVHVTDAAQRRQKELGHQYLLLTPLLNPAPGPWRLDIEHPRASGNERLQLLPSQFPRFELRLGLVGGAQRIGAGSERLVELWAGDQGQPAQGLQPQGSALHLDSGTRTPLQFWQARPASYDLPVQAGPGQYFAVFAPDAPGRYTLQVQQDFSGRDGAPAPQQRQLDLAVAPQAVLRSLRVAQPPGPSGCVPRVDFSVDWPAQAPGRYTLVVVLKGNAGTRQFTGGSTATGAGSLRLQAAASARELLALGDAAQLLRVDVLHLPDGGFDLLQRRRALPLSEPLLLEHLCR